MGKIKLLRQSIFSKKKDKATNELLYSYQSNENSLNISINSKET